jgi:hypothetical protein
MLPDNLLHSCELWGMHLLTACDDIIFNEEGLSLDTLLQWKKLCCTSSLSISVTVSV